MDDSKRKGISIKTLEEVKKKINPELLEGLPYELEEILEYVTRRTDPVISPNINKELKEKMLNSRVSDEDYLVMFIKAMQVTLAEKEPSKDPQAQILIAQTGAGKTNLRTYLLRKEPNTVIINSDLYKKFREDREEILKSDPSHYGALTGIDSYDIAKNLTDLSISKGFNILFECAPSLKQGLIGVDLENLEKNGYNPQFHVMAVGNLISAMAIHKRFEFEQKTGTNKGNSKLTDLDRHNESYSAVSKVLVGLPQSKINVYRRGTEEEGQVPAMISNMKTNPPMLALEAERIRSNSKYVTTGGFDEDYESVSNDMASRKDTTSSQREQLEQVYKMGEDYKSYWLE